MNKKQKNDFAWVQSTEKKKKKQVKNGLFKKGEEII